MFLLSILASLRRILSSLTSEISKSLSLALKQEMRVSVVKLYSFLS